MMVSLPPDYRPNEAEEFMSPIQVEYFRQKLLRWRNDLLRDADVALYQAKAVGKNRFEFFRPEMQTDIGRRIALEVPPVQKRIAQRGGRVATAQREIAAHQLGRSSLVIRRCGSSRFQALLDAINVRDAHAMAQSA